MRHLLLSLLLTLPLVSAEYPAMGADVFDVNANAMADIADALTRAKSEKKHVLLKFGANWCIDCHRLSHTLATAPAVARSLADHYILVSIDTNTRNRSNRNLDVVAQYGQPSRHSLPAILVLDTTGKVLTTQRVADFEDGSAHDPAKILAFLTKWIPAS